MSACVRARAPTVREFIHAKSACDRRWQPHVSLILVGGFFGDAKGRRVLPPPGPVVRVADDSAWAAEKQIVLDRCWWWAAHRQRPSSSDRVLCALEFCNFRNVIIYTKGFASASGTAYRNVCTLGCQWSMVVISQCAPPRTPTRTV